MQCTAKSKRTGEQCGAYGMANGKCYHHGGKTNNIGNTHAVKPGSIYSKHLTLSEQADSAALALGTVDEELRLCRIMLARCLAANTDEPELDAIVMREGAEKVMAGREEHYKRTDYTQRAHMLMGRIESMEKTRKELLSKSDEGNIVSARTIINPDE